MSRVRCRDEEREGRKEGCRNEEEKMKESR